MSSMKTPVTRAEFERNFHLLYRQIIDGKLHFAQGISMDGLGRVRFLPNGRIDFLSIDETARLYANSMAHFDTKIIQELLKHKEPPDLSSDAKDGDLP